MLRANTWDVARVVGLAVLAAVAIRQWLKNSEQRRGKQLTRELLLRAVISTGAGSAISLLTFGIAYYSHNDRLSIPIMPGFLIGAITVGVHRNDNLLMYATIFLNMALYGAVVFLSYPVLFRKEKS